ncbi:hypothetical protein F442_12926 [Phytophthora nicotianae P10297]|uniref:ZSWIM1/3 RNaseH-like domain-containing protein n=1 Tax=Phytophthora nicotianae P10297 TaxID=1317064 RepID=W2YX57_PHYNI|nr:hypothetical protein F442_12926 [Phytophthora nicotianae P10297]
MLTDNFGSGAFAQHALVDGEKQENMKSAITAFKRNNGNWSDVKVIVIDKYFTELSTLESEFPEATVILCRFHVIDYLKREVGKRDYGFTGFEKLHIRNFLTCVVRTSRESEFNHYLEALECIETLLFLQQSADDTYKFKTKRAGIRVNSKYDDEMKRLARIATHHACDLVEDQYKVRSKVVYTVEASALPGYDTFVNPESSKSYAASCENNTCSCVFQPNTTSAVPSHRLSAPQTVSPSCHTGCCCSSLLGSPG